MHKPRRRSKQWFYGMSFATSLLLSGRLVEQHEYVLAGLMVLLAIYWYRADSRGKED